MASKTETFTADGQSTLTELTAIVLTAAADAASVSLREGGAAGTVKFKVSAAIGATATVPLPGGADSASGAWYVDFTAGTSPQCTVVGR